MQHPEQQTFAVAKPVCALERAGSWALDLDDIGTEIRQQLEARRALCELGETHHLDAREGQYLFRTCHLIAPLKAADPAAAGGIGDVRLSQLPENHF